jgi:hypothetical protein
MWHYNDVLRLSMPLGESQDSLAAGFFVPAILPMNTMVMVPKRWHLSHVSNGTRGQPPIHSHTLSHEESI